MSSPRVIPIHILRKVLFNLPDSFLYDMLGGEQETYAKVELSRRNLPLTKRGRKKRGTMSAKRRCGVTGGFVDHSTITPMPRPALAGQPIEPWNKYAKTQGINHER